MTTLIANAKDQDELYSALRAIDISVPGRQGGRTPKHRERWTFCRLLSSLAGAEKIVFPVSADHDDKPDFLVDLGSVDIGVEVTDATNEKYSQYLSLAARYFPNAVRDVGMFLPGRPEPSIEEMRRQLSANKLISPPWSSLEPDWADAIFRSIEKKTAKLARSDMRKCSENWLAIYSNTPFEDIRTEDAADILCKRLQDHWKPPSSFHKIFIEHRRVVIAISADGWIKLPLNDLWFPPDPISEAIENFDENDSDDELWNELWR